MGAFARGDIVLYPFPFTDLKGRKLRPCLVLSEEMQDDILLCQITSQHSRKDEFALDLGTKETLNGSLMIDSFIRCNMLFTAEKSEVQKKICKLSKGKYAEVCRKINGIISEE